MEAPQKTDGFARRQNSGCETACKLGELCADSRLSFNRALRRENCVNWNVNSTAIFYSLSFVAIPPGKKFSLLHGVLFSFIHKYSFS